MSRERLDTEESGTTGHAGERYNGRRDGRRVGGQRWRSWFARTCLRGSLTVVNVYAVC